MPIKIPNDLPARRVLEEERVSLIREKDAIRQDIRPLKIALLNLMPDKIKTETQLLRVLGATPLQIEVTLIRTGSYTGKNTGEDHLLNFYVTLDDLSHERFDALIITGAPVEHMDFEDVKYWAELQQILDWSQQNVYSTFCICWGAQAALYHFHKVDKTPLPDKQFGVFPHYVVYPNHPLIKGFDDIFQVPVSRHTEVRHADLAPVTSVDILAESKESGVCLAYEPDKRRVYMFNHLEYEAATLGDEYRRDVDAGYKIAPPANYFPDNDPAQAPLVTWRSARNLLFGNWINMVYQGTPFDLAQL